MSDTLVMFNTIDSDIGNTLVMVISYNPFMVKPYTLVSIIVNVVIVVVRFISASINKIFSIYNIYFFKLALDRPLPAALAFCLDLS